MQVLISEEYLTDVGDAIREKNGLETQYLPNEFGVAIRALPVTEELPLESITVTRNDTYTPSAGYGGISQVKVKVPTQSYSANANGTVLPSGKATTSHTLNYVWSTEAQSVN